MDECGNSSPVTEKEGARFQAWWAGFEWSLTLAEHFPTRHCVPEIVKGHKDQHGDMSRVYIGRLSYRAREKDVEKFFKGYGKILEVDLKNG